jgi:hypothetical protein
VNYAARGRDCAEALLRKMDALFATPVYRIYWVNEQQTILCLEARNPWSWQDALDALNISNDILQEIPPEVDTFTIIHFLQGVSFIPDGRAATRLHELLLADTEFEKLVIFVGSEGLLFDMLKIVSRVYGLQRLFTRFRFVRSFTDALSLIDSYRQTHMPVEQSDE